MNKNPTPAEVKRPAQFQFLPVSNLAKYGIKIKRLKISDGVMLMEHQEFATLATRFTINGSEGHFHCPVPAGKLTPAIVATALRTLADQIEGKKSAPTGPRIPPRLLPLQRHNRST